MTELEGKGRTSWNKGLSSWNKGITKYRGLFEDINRVLEREELTIDQLYPLVGDGMVFTYFCNLLRWARAKGFINRNLIKEWHMRQPKFQVGDRVRIRRLGNQHTPQFLLKELRIDNPRTIIAVFPGGSNKPTRYYLGTNKHNDKNGELERHAFKAKELSPYKKQAIGRPRLKRHYNRNQAADRDNLPLGTKGGQGIDSVVSPSISCVN